MVHPLHLCDRQLCREARCEHKAARSSDVFMSCQALSCGPARAFRVALSFTWMQNTRGRLMKQFAPRVGPVIASGLA